MNYAKIFLLIIVIFVPTQCRTITNNNCGGTGFTNNNNNDDNSDKDIVNDNGCGDKGKYVFQFQDNQ